MGQANILRTVASSLMVAASTAFSAANAEPQATISAGPSAAVATVARVSFADVAKKFEGGKPALGARAFTMRNHLLPNGNSTSGASTSPSGPGPAGVSTNTSATIAFPQSSSAFMGITTGTSATLNGYQVEPPDQGLAANGDWVVETNNMAIQITNLATAQKQSASLYSFFGNDPNTCGDPQVFFDPDIGRWIVTQLSSATCASQTGFQGFDVAVSADEIPTSTYTIYRIRAFSNDITGCGGVDCFPDYPKAGFNRKGFFISANLFSSTSSAFVNAATYVLSKDQLLTGSPNPSVSRVNYPGDFTVQPTTPAVDTSLNQTLNYIDTAGGTELLIEARYIYNLQRRIRVFALTGTDSLATSSPSLAVKYVDFSSQAYGSAVASTQPNYVGAYCISQGKTAPPKLDGGYGAFQATASVAKIGASSTGGTVYGVLPFASQDSNRLSRDVLAWFALNVTVSSSGTPSVPSAQQGYIIPPNGYSMFSPAMAVKTNKYALAGGIFGFTIVNNLPTNNSAVLYPSAGYVSFLSLPLSNPVINISGVGTTTEDSFTGCSSTSTNTTARWGDYGAAVVNAANFKFYVANEYIPAKVGDSITSKATNWGTFITPVGP